MSDAMSQVQDESVDVDSFPCPACGGQMRFDPSSQMLACEYCDNRVELSQEGFTIQEYDLDSAEEEASHDWGMSTVSVHCNSCGANSVMDKSETASFCAYCGSSQIITENGDAGIKPESLIPFQMNRESARDEFKKWINGKWMSPKALKHELKSDRLTGVYVPHWTYDANTSSYYHCMVGHDYYVTQSYQSTEDGKVVTKTRQVRKTRWHSKSGHYDAFFDDILINASGKFYHEKIQALEPYYLKDLVPYKPEYLSGFIAEKYAVPLQDGYSRAQSSMQDKIRSSIISTQHADHVKNLSVQTAYEDVKFKHLLLPIWISSYIYKEKTYQYMINGQTGEVQGDAPMSWVKVGFIIVAILAAIAGIYFYTQMQ